MSDHYDVVTVGGGLGGSGFGRLMADRGARVLVLERAKEFRDRIRGEVLVPWGVIEARRLGFEDLLRPIGNDLSSWVIAVGGEPIIQRNIPETCVPEVSVLTYFHPQMQDLLLQAAVDAGAEVQTGARVTAVTPGNSPRLSYSQAGVDREVTARIIVGADGRDSSVRRWAEFETARAEERRLFGGILFEDMRAPSDVLFSSFLLGTGLMTYVFPQGEGRVRAYVGSQKGSDVERFQGEKDIPRFVETAIRIGVPEEHYRGARPAGPLATFDATDEWVPHPYRAGVALVGDAASTSDPTWGQGMSLTLRDLRTLRDALVADEDWEAAGNAYAVEKSEYTERIRTADTWYTDILLDVGPDADAIRERALPGILEDPTRIVDTPISGPEIVPDEVARQRFFGE